MSKLRPRIGLIVPPAHGRVPPEAPLLYGERFEFIARGVGIDSVSPKGFARTVEQIVDHARALRDEGAQAISLMGTSLSFYQGPAFANQLRDILQKATGVPCTTMSHAVVAALQTLGVQRVAVATSYIDELNTLLVHYLDALGFEVKAIEGLGIEPVGGAARVSTERLITLSRQVHARAPEAQGIFMSCGGLFTLDAIAALEGELGIPAIGSSPCGFWDVVRAAGEDPRSNAAGGRLFSYV